MNQSESVGRYGLVHLVHQGYLGPLWAARGHFGEAQDIPALVRKIELPAGLGEEQQTLITEAAWDGLELSHPNLLTGAEVVFAEGLFALAYDYVEAEVLQALLLMGTVKKTPLKPAVVARILLDVVEGLAAVTAGAKALGVKPYFGGVTPESILVGSDGNARVIDCVVGGAITATTELRLATGRVGYCSPEQLRGETATEQSDVFALGVILAELLAGRRLLLGSGTVIEKRILEGKLPQINGWLKPGGGIEGGALDVLDRALCPDPGQRIDSLRALVEEFCAATPEPADRAQVGAAVTALASKQLEVRARKLGLHNGPRLSQRASPVRASRPGQAGAALPAGVQAPRAVTVESLQHSSEPAGPHEAPTLAPGRMEGSQESPEPQTNEAAAVDELLGGIDTSGKREEMQSGTHRKALSTLIGVAPPPRAMIGRTPGVTVPTTVTLTDAPSNRSRNAAGIADLIGTAVPSTRDGAPGPESSAGAATPQLKVSASPGSSERPFRDSELGENVRDIAEQRDRYRRLTVLLGSTTVLLLTLLTWLVVQGLREFAEQPVHAPRRVAIVQHGPGLGASASSTRSVDAPSDEDQKQDDAPVAPADSVVPPPANPAPSPRAVRPAPRKPATQAKKFIPEDI